jgi:tetratricopeptide (TPR) repeat protein
MERGYIGRHQINRLLPLGGFVFHRFVIAALWLMIAACSGLDQKDQAPARDQAGDEPATVTAEPEPPPSRPIPADTLYDLLVAEMAGHQNNYELALQNYVYQAQETRDIQVTARAAHLAQYLGATEVAAQMAELWIELEPDNSEPHFIYALALAEQGQLDKAFAQMKLSANYGGEAAYTAIAAQSLRFSREQQQALLGVIEGTLAQQPNDVELLMAKSIVQQSTDKEAALRTARQARAAAPGESQPVVLEATLLQQMDRPEEAIQLLRQSLAVHPQNRRMRLLYARLLTQSDLPAAREQFEVLLQQAPDDADLVFSLGLINRELEQFEDAEGYFLQLLEMGQRESEAHYYLGLMARETDQLQAAITHFKMVRPGQDFLPAMNQLAEILLTQDKEAQLRRFYADQRRHYPQVAPDLYILEAEILVQSQRAEAALKLLDEALDRYPDSTNLLYTRSLVAEKQGNLPQAEADLRRIIELEPDNASALNALGYILTNHTKRFEEATRLIEQALDLSPNDPTVLDSMGWVKYRVGDLTLALDYLQRAYDLYPDTEIGAHLGEVLWQLGRQQQAIEVWSESYARDPQHEVLIETLTRFKVTEQVRARD